MTKKNRGGEVSLPMTRRVKLRMVVVLGLLTVLLLMVLLRLFYLQVVAGDELRASGLDQQMREVPVAAGRGVIYDRELSALAVSVSVDSVYASPTEISAEQAPDVAEALCGLLELDYDRVLKKLTSGRSYEWIARKIDDATSAALKELALPGVGITTETERNYPNGSFLCHVLGFAGIDNQGLEGIEASLDETLQGSDGYVLAQYDSHGNEIAGSARRYVEPTDGNSVVLTIDRNIQYFAERELDNLMAGPVDPKGAYIVMMDPHTGEILALACRPAYDPNDFGNYDAALWRNGAISDFYEPGSTAKIMTIAAALEENAVKESDTFYDGGSITVGGKRIRCWSTTPHGSQTFVEVAENSCNPAFVEVGQRMDAADELTFWKYLRNFGIGQATGICLPGESSGSLRDLGSAEKVNVLDVANMYIGQGYGVSALQLVTAVSAAVNGGTLMEPILVKTVLDSEGAVVEEAQPKAVRRVISAQTSERLCAILESVVANGTGSKAFIEGYRVGGKTGTAQKFIDGAYSRSKYVASFIGMAPADDPRLVCLVVIDEPSSYPYYGGTIAAPVFQRVVADALHYLKVEPQVSAGSIEEGEGLTVLTEIMVPDVVGLPLDEAEQVLKDGGFAFRTEGSGDHIAAQVPAGLTVVKSNVELLLTLGDSGDQSVEVPDLAGKRLLHCDELLAARGLVIFPEGHGKAVLQEPAAGTRVERGTAVRVLFEEDSGSVDTMAP